MSDKPTSTLPEAPRPPTDTSTLADHASRFALEDQGGRWARLDSIQMDPTIGYRAALIARIHTTTTRATAADPRGRSIGTVRRA